MHHKGPGSGADRRRGPGSPESVFKQSKIQFWRCGRRFEIRSMCCANMLFNHRRCVRVGRRARARLMLLQATAKEEDPAVGVTLISAFVFDSK